MGRRVSAMAEGNKEPCPDCGDDPEVDDCHRSTCPRIGTCAQCGPPWMPLSEAHPEIEFTGGKPFTAAALSDHMRRTHAARWNSGGTDG